jgi:thioredoxin 1
MLYTSLKHIECASELNRIILENDRVVVICGRMDPASVSVYRMADELEKKYPQVQFFDMEYDDPESENLRKLPEVIEFAETPFTVYFREGKLVKAASGILSIIQVSNSLMEDLKNNNNLK